jgi:hypothetical protein
MGILTLGIGVFVLAMLYLVLRRRSQKQISDHIERDKTNSSRLNTESYDSLRSNELEKAKHRNPNLVGASVVGGVPNWNPTQTATMQTGTQSDQIPQTYVPVIEDGFTVAGKLLDRDGLEDKKKQKARNQTFVNARIILKSRSTPITAIDKARQRKILIRAKANVDRAIVIAQGVTFAERELNMLKQTSDQLRIAIALRQTVKTKALRYAYAGGVPETSRREKIRVHA